MNSPKSSVAKSDERRILNEIAFKVRNEAQVNRIIDERSSNGGFADFQESLFQCECDDSACTELINISLEEYTRSHTHLMRFIVIPEHIQTDIEKVIETFSNYAIVHKFFPDKSEVIAG